MEQDEGMSEYWTGAVGGAPGGYGTSRSLAFTERRSQPAHQYSLSRSSSGLQWGRRNKVAEVTHCTRWWWGGGGGGVEASTGDKRVPLSHTQKEREQREEQITEQKGVTPPGLKGAANGSGGEFFCRLRAIFFSPGVNMDNPAPNSP